MSNTDYIPIACHFYDELETLAVRKTLCKIEYKDENEIKIIEDFIVNFKNKNKEEFAILKSDIQIRLDKIISVNSLKATDYNCDV